MVAYDTESKKFRPFQVLSTRKKKDVAAKDVKVKVIICAFDLLYLNGKSLLKVPLLERREKMRASFAEAGGCRPCRGSRCGAPS